MRVNSKIKTVIMGKYICLFALNFTVFIYWYFSVVPLLLGVSFPFMVFKEIVKKC